MNILTAILLRIYFVISLLQMSLFIHNKMVNVCKKKHLGLCDGLTNLF